MADQRCVVKDGEIASLNENIDFDCDVEEGAVLRIGFEEPVKKKHRHKEIKHMEPEVEAPQPEQQPEPTATVAVPSSDGPADLSSLTELAGSNGGIGVIMALIAVAGGGAAWKFYSQHSAQKHEQAMARIEKESSSHQACEAKRIELQAKVDALEGKVSKLNSSFDFDAPSTSDLDRRVKTLERKVKTPRKTQ